MTTSAENHLIELLPRAEQRSFVQGCEAVALTPGQVLCDSGRRMRHAYFPLTGCASLVVPMEPRGGLAVGLVGREGMLGSQLGLGVSVPAWRLQVVGAGVARRMAATDFARARNAGGALQGVLNRYLHLQMSQLAATLLCLHFHGLAQRLARWLLTLQDRAQGGSFHVTHEFLAGMLGVRRVGVTVAASAMQRRGLIGYHRGDVTVLDRVGLEAVSCACHAAEREAAGA